MKNYKMKFVFEYFSVSKCHAIANLVGFTIV